ncbi:hybrid sensor histidine kinase/response regulator [Acuticoccus yangtzensis]|uniref:hybrid sensor histidine kinase/response regulator n=1 Tax=Acuticoccus yangtzensis TaxID=1443441 RepID=UPI000949660E|nr:PAS domain-containing hybrid sensor histidine kinase/response regulator [Acuticoccus yangtzensis]
MAQAAPLPIVRLVRTEGAAWETSLFRDGQSIVGGCRVEVTTRPSLKAAYESLAFDDILVLADHDLEDGAVPERIAAWAERAVVMAVGAMTDLPAAVAVVPGEDALANALPIVGRQAGLLRDARRHQRNLTHLINVTPDALIVIGEEGVVQRANATARQWFAPEGEDLAGEHITFSVGPEGAELDVTVDGEPRIGDVRLAEIEWDDRPATLALVRDITLMKTLQDKLAEAQKSDAIRLMAGGIAHEFNNMLVVAMTNLYFLREQVQSPEAQRQLDGVDKIIERARSLANQMLILSQAHASAPARLDIANTLSDQYALWRTTIPSNITLEVNAGDASRYILVDEVELRQVLNNLILNATAATGPGGKITVSTGATTGSPNGLPRGDYATITVRDTGSGIDPDVLPRIFDPFFTTRPTGQGQGLGLSVSRGYVRKCGGTIKVSSTVGEGTAITLYFPRDEGPAESAMAAAIRTHGKPHILLLEDDDDVAHVMRRVLERGGYQVTRRDNGLDGQALIRRDKTISLVVSDVVMPKFGGRELAAWLFRSRPELKLILVTGYSDSVEWLEAIKDDTRDYLLKPFPPTVLLKEVRRMLNGAVAE